MTWLATTGGMTPQEMHEFLQGPWIAHLACLKPDGSPYVVPVWYHWDGVCFWVVLPHRVRSVWLPLAADPRVWIVVDEPEPPFRKASARARRS